MALFDMLHAHAGVSAIVQNCKVHSRSLALIVLQHFAHEIFLRACMPLARKSSCRTQSMNTNYPSTHTGSYGGTHLGCGTCLKWHRLRAFSPGLDLAIADIPQLGCHCYVLFVRGTVSTFTVSPLSSKHFCPNIMSEASVTRSVSALVQPNDQRVSHPSCRCEGSPCRLPLDRFALTIQLAAVV